LWKSESSIIPEEENPGSAFSEDDRHLAERLANASAFWATPKTNSLL
jgi:hypothetical protein